MEKNLKYISCRENAGDEPQTVTLQAQRVQIQYGISVIKGKCNFFIGLF